MFAKKVFYASASLLAITIALQLGARMAMGQTGGFRLIGTAMVSAGGSVYHLDVVNFPEGWKILPTPSYTLPPIPVSSIASYDGDIAITDAGEGWGKVGGVWTDLGPIPGVATVRTSWGQVKDRYRR